MTDLRKEGHVCRTWADTDLDYLMRHVSELDACFYGALASLSSEFGSKIGVSNLLSKDHQQVIILDEDDDAHKARM